MGKQQKGRSFFSWLQFRLLLLIGVGLLLWAGYGWWQKTSSSRETVNNSHLTMEVLAEIGRRAPYDLLNIQVTANKGSVTISGKIRNNSEKEELLKLIKGVTGVKNVVANVEIDPTLRTPNEVKEDSILALKVKGVIAVEEGLRAFQIKVVSHKGIITLEGKVPFKEQRTLAEQVSLKVKGAKQVINKLTLYKKDN